MRKNAIYIPNPQEDLRTIEDDNQYDQVAPDEIRSLSSESDLAESPAGHTIRSSYKSPIFDTPLEPCPVNGCPLNPQSGIIIPQIPQSGVKSAFFAKTENFKTNFVYGLKMAAKFKYSLGFCAFLDIICILARKFK